MIDVVLHAGRDRSVRRRHPWVFSGAIARVTGEPEAGVPARVLSAEGDLLGHGYLSPGSAIRVRLHAFGKEPPDPEWLSARVQGAVERRHGDPLLDGCDAVRLVNSEGDGLPGLVADRYGDTVVVKLSSAGLARQREALAEVLRHASGAARGYERADTLTARQEGIPAHQGVLWGPEPECPLAIREQGRRYQVDVVHGQKTGFYLDQRDARDLVQAIASGRRVLDLFAYTGGFAVAAAQGGARSVTLVDSSAAAVELARENLASYAAIPKAIHEADAFRFVRRDEATYDLVIVDPPPLARRRRDVPRAARAYKDLLLHALRRVAPGGLVLGFACSHYVGPDLFRKIAFAASLDAGRSVQVLRTLGAPVDHPVSIDHPEGDYLTGLLLRA